MSHGTGRRHHPTGRDHSHCGAASTRHRGGGLASIAAFAVLAAVLAAGPAAPAAAAQDRATAVAPAGKIVGSGKTKALFAKVHRAYLHVPAVELSAMPGASSLRFARRFVLVLRDGVVVAEEFTRPGRGGVTLVARRFHATFARAAGGTCWRRLPASDPRTLADVGLPYPYTRVNIKVLPPRRTALGWVVASENRAEFWFLALQPKRPAHLLDHSHLPIKRFVSYAIDARSYRLRSLFVQQPRSGQPQRSWPTATLRVRALATAPRLPAPAPVC